MSSAPRLRRPTRSRSCARPEQTITGTLLGAGSWSGPPRSRHSDRDRARPGRPSAVKTASSEAVALAGLVDRVARPLEEVLQRAAGVGVVLGHEDRQVGGSLGDRCRRGPGGASWCERHRGTSPGASILGTSSCGTGLGAGTACVGSHGVSSTGEPGRGSSGRARRGAAAPRRTVPSSAVQTGRSRRAEHHANIPLVFPATRAVRSENHWPAGFPGGRHGNPAPVGCPSQCRLEVRSAA